MLFAQSDLAENNREGHHAEIQSHTNIVKIFSMCKYFIENFKIKYTIYKNSISVVGGLKKTG